MWLDVWSEWGSHPCSSFLHFLRIVILPVRLDLAPVTIALIPPAGALFFLPPSPFLRVHRKCYSHISAYTPPLVSSLAFFPLYVHTFPIVPVPHTKPPHAL